MSACKTMHWWWGHATCCPPHPTFAMHLSVSNADCSVWHKAGIVLKQCLRGGQRCGCQQDAPQQLGAQGLKVWLLPEWRGALWRLRKNDIYRAAASCTSAAAQAGLRQRRCIILITTCDGDL